jgi:hypothetical protein
MVVQVLSNSRQVMNRSDADLFEMIGGADTRQHQELGRVESARGKDYLAIGAHRLDSSAALIFDANGALAL